MRLTLAFFLPLASLLAAPVLSGPWLREEGSGFASLSIEAATFSAFESDAYAEYGLTPNLTIGAKLHTQMHQDGFGDTEAAAFLRFPLGPTDRTWRAAYDIGLSYRRDDNISGIALRLGASVGRGLSFAEGGWLVFDASVDLPTGELSTLFKLDSTLGINVNESWKAMMQIFVSGNDFDARVTFAPSLIWRPKRAKSQFQFGLETEEGRTSARLSIWRDF